MGLRLFLALSVIGWVGTVQAAPVCTHADSLDRPRIGLALGGGGARGISHIGVIRILEELRVPVDYVAGTSMGSIVGGFYATGMNSDELEATVNSVDWTAIFKDQTDRADRTFRRKRDDDLSLYGPKFGVGDDSELLPSGAVSGQKIVLLFEDVAGSRVQIDHFDQLPIPFRAVATDIIDGNPVIIEDDNLAMAMRSSMSIPGIFAPVPYRDHLLVDGGIAKNLPVDVVRGMGADIVIAVDVGSPLHDAKELDNLLTITGQLSNILVQRNTMAQRARLTEQDVLIVPNLGDKVSSADFQKGEEAIGIGLEAGRSAVSELASLGVSEADYAAHRAGIEACVAGVPVIEFFELDNRSRFSDEVIARRLHVELCHLSGCGEGRAQRGCRDGDPGLPRWQLPGDRSGSGRYERVDHP
jgi:NTE family protein